MRQDGSRSAPSIAGGSVDPFANSDILGSLTAEDRARLTDQCMERRFDKGQTVYCQGEPADSMLVLKTGCLKISTFSSEGDELVVSKVLPGKIIGELGILSNAPRSATVVAVQRSTALTLPRTVVMDLVERRPAVAIAMLEQLANMVRRTTDTAADLVFLSLAQRVAKYLLERDAQPRTDMRITQAELASAIGASRQRVNACLQNFQRQGLIALAPKSIRLSNRNALSELVTS